MKYTNLPHTDLKVSKICLGTMTWGNQNTEAEGHAQMDLAFEKGVNFFDTAELYPVPATAETQGRTSEIVGTWLKKTGNRDKLVIASKIAGPGDQTDYIDLYQLHWPERHTNMFGVRDYTHDVNDAWQDNFNEILHANLNNIIFQE